MLRDRRALLEAEILKMTRECGQFYLTIVTGPTSENGAAMIEYQNQIAKLTNLKTELSVVNHMIAEGSK
jgi:hypothetical protein